jgi:hypothetical protein
MSAVTLEIAEAAACSKLNRSGLAQLIFTSAGESCERER